MRIDSDCSAAQFFFFSLLSSYTTAVPPDDTYCISQDTQTVLWHPNIVKGCLTDPSRLTNRVSGITRRVMWCVSGYSCLFWLSLLKGYLSVLLRVEDTVVESYQSCLHWSNITRGSFQGLTMHVIETSKYSATNHSFYYQLIWLPFQLNDILVYEMSQIVKNLHRKSPDPKVSRIHTELCETITQYVCIIINEIQLLSSLFNSLSQRGRGKRTSSVPTGLNITWPLCLVKCGQYFVVEFHCTHYRYVDDAQDLVFLAIADHDMNTIVTYCRLHSHLVLSGQIFKRSLQAMFEKLHFWIIWFQTDLS